MPWGGTFHGHGGVFAHFLSLIEHINSRLQHASLFAAGDYDVQSGRTGGAVVANGATFGVAEAHVWHFRDGKIILYDAYIETPAMVDALNR